LGAVQKRRGCLEGAEPSRVAHIAELVGVSYVKTRDTVAEGGPKGGICIACAFVWKLTPDDDIGAEPRIDPWRPFPLASFASPASRG
jgi:hypothetical protein